MDIQPRSVRVLSVPDYYAEYRETGNGYAAFLGASITAKVSLCHHHHGHCGLLSSEDHFQRIRWEKLCIKIGICE